MENTKSILENFVIRLVYILFTFVIENVLSQVLKKN